MVGKGALRDVNALLTNMVVMVRVVLKRVSVTLMEGSFLSMESPSSECHWPICKGSMDTHTHTHTHTQISVIECMRMARFSVSFVTPYLKDNWHDLSKVQR